MHNNYIAMKLWDEDLWFCFIKQGSHFDILQDHNLLQ